MDLPGIMANLDLKDQQQSTSSSPYVDVTSRSLRKRVQSNFHQDSTPTKRRCSKIPKKIFKDLAAIGLESYYRNEKYKSPSLQSLETIYEEPLVKSSGSLLFLGANKHRRISFTGKVTKNKLKKRKSKIKNFHSVKHADGKSKGKRLTMEAFLARLEGIMASNLSSNNNETVLPLPQE